MLNVVTREKWLSLYKVATTYDDAGNATIVTTLHRYHDGSGTGALVAGTNARPAHTAYWHDALGRQVAMAEYGNQASDATAFTRPSTIPARSDTVLVSETAYNDQGEAFKTIDPAGKEDRMEFDDAGRRTKTIENYKTGSSANDDEDVTVEFTYTSEGNLATIKAKNSGTGDQTTTYVYGTDKGGIVPAVYRNDLVRAEIYPDSDDVASPLGNGADGTYDRVEYKYNRQGEVIERKVQAGSVHSYDYDKLGRQTQDRITTLGTGVDGAVRRIATTYNSRGLVEKVTSYDNATVGSGSVVNEVVREYNDLGLLRKEFQAHDGAKGVSTPYVEYTYDQTASGGELTKGYRLTKIRYPNGRLVHYTYGSAASTADNLNRLDAVKDDNAGVPGNVLASYTYLGSGTVVKIDYQQPDVRLDLIDTGHAYSGFDRFMRIADQRWFDYGSSVDADRYKYGYDRASSRKYRENTLTSAKDEFYTYDGMHRLETFDRGDLNGTYTGMTGTPVREQDWTLDELGNWAQFVQRSSGSTDLDHSRDHNKANELTQFNTTSGLDWQDPVYDRNGNATSIPRPSSPISSFALTYDAWNRMVTLKLGVLTLGSYKYDGLSRRVQTTSGSTVRHFYYSDQWQALEERLGASTSAESQYIWGLRYIDELILRERDTDGNGSLNERLYYLQDANFNVTALVNTTGTVQERYAYEPYGELIVLTPAWGSRSSSSFANPYTYTGRRRDTESGLYYYRYRYYHAQLGRFVGRDPIHSDFNLYGYGAGNPPVSTDPFGRSSRQRNCINECSLGCDKEYGWYNPQRYVCRSYCDNVCTGTPDILDDLATLGNIACSKLNNFMNDKRVMCACGVIGVADLASGNTLVEVADCACNFLATLQTACNRGLRGAALMAALTALDCSSVSLGALGCAVGGGIGGVGGVGGAIIGCFVGSKLAGPLVDVAAWVAQNYDQQGRPLAIAQAKACCDVFAGRI